MTALNVFGTRLKMACKDLTFATRTFDQSYNLSSYNIKLINLKKLLYVWYYQYHLTKFWPFIIRLKNSQKFYFQPAIIWLEHCLAIHKSSSDPALLNTIHGSYYEIFSYLYNPYFFYDSKEVVIVISLHLIWKK